MKQIHANIPQEAVRDKINCRDGIELLRRRVEWLVGEDRVLMTMYLDNGNTFYQMAKLAGVNEVTVARRIGKIVRRLTDGGYITCLRHRERFTAAEMEIAKGYFLMGLSMKDIAGKGRYSYYMVRKTVHKLQRLTTLGPTVAQSELKVANSV